MPDVVAPFSDLTHDGKLNALYSLLLDTRGVTMALQDQITELTTRVGIVETALTTVNGKLGELQASVDAEQAEVADALSLLTQDNPDLTAAIGKLTNVSANLDAISTTLDATKADVESTVTPAP